MASKRICFAFIDCDLRESITYCAEMIWPVLVPGGIIVFDDYLSQEYKGARLAIDNFISRHYEESSEHKLLQRLYYIIRKG